MTLIYAALHPPPPPPLAPSHAQSQKRQTPTVDSAHVRGLIWIVVLWLRGMARLARGACRREACQRAFKEPRPQKRKQMAAGITTLMDCTCSLCAPLPLLLFNQCPESPLGALKWKNVSMRSLSVQHQITRSLLTPVQRCTLSQTEQHNSCLRPALLHCCSPANMWQSHPWNPRKNDDLNKLEMNWGV